MSGKKPPEPIFRSTDSIVVRKRERKGEKVCTEFRYSVPLPSNMNFESVHGSFSQLHNPIVYSDLYFKYNRPLNGVIKNLLDYTQLENNSLVCGYYFDEQDYIKTQNQLKIPHLSIFEVKKTIEYNAVLKNLFVQYDFDINIAAFRAKCFENAEKNSCSFRDYVPLIRVNLTDAYEQYFEVKRFEEMSNRISHIPSRKKKFGKIWASNLDLDRITPVKFKKRERENMFNLSSLSVHELEEILLSRKRVEKELKHSKVRSLEDVRIARSFPILEPLLLKEDDDIDSEKVRLRISEHKKIVRITIAYTLAFFILAIITFYIIYYA